VPRINVATCLYDFHIWDLGRIYSKKGNCSNYCILGAKAEWRRYNVHSNEEIVEEQTIDR
jgi:hypothetical protein